MRPLVGRDREAAAVRGVVRDAAQERALGAVVVEGAPGMGVGALVRVAVTEALAAGMTVIRVPVASASPPMLTPGDDPVLLVVEELQRATADLVAGLRAVRATRPVAFVAATRDVERGPGAALVEDLVLQGADVLRLEPLDDDTVLQLAEHALGAPCGPTLRRVLARAGGVPAAVVELLDGLRRESRIAREGGLADVEGEELPASVRDAVVRPVSALPAPTQDALQVIAAFGAEGVETAALALVLGRSAADVARDLEPVDAQGVLVHDGTRVAFRYRLLREALYESLAPSLRSAVHGEIAHVLAAAGHDASEIARHVVGADGMAPGAVAADAAWACRRTAPRLALDACRVTLAAPLPDELRVRVAAASVWPLVTQGHLDEAEATARELLASDAADPVVATEASWCLVAIRQRRGQAAAGLAELLALLERPTLPETERRWLLARLPIAHVLTGDVDAANAVADELLRDPVLAADDDVAVAARVPIVFRHLSRGEVADGVRVAQEIGARLQYAPPSSAEGMGIVVPSALVEADRFDEARAALIAGARRDGEIGDRSVVSIYDVWLIIVDVLTGAWDDAVAAAESVHVAVRDDGGAAIVALYALAYPAAVQVRRGDIDAADRLVTVAERALEERGPQNGADVVLWARSLVLDARGARPDAAALLALEWDLTAPVRYFQSWRSVAPDLVRLALATGDAGRARAVTEEAEEGARRASTVASASGAALRCRGLLENDPDVLIAAVDVLTSGSRRPDTAAAALDAGLALAAAGRRAEAVAALDVARGVAGAIGAWRDLRTIESRLAALGAGTRRGARGATASGWAALTAREAEVAALVAEGLRNPQVAERLGVSRHTVESHIKSIFVKLDISSRTQLAAEVLRQRPNT